MQTVLVLHIVLGDVAALAVIGDAEHAGGGADILNHRGDRLIIIADMGREYQLLAGAGLEGQGDLDILDIILGKGEDILRDIQHTSCNTTQDARAARNHDAGIGTAAEVGDLEVLVDGAALLDGDGAFVTGAGAVDEAPGVQIAAAGDHDGAVASHLDHAQGAGGCAVAGAGGQAQAVLACAHVAGLGTGHAQAALDGQLCAAGHGQGAVSGGIGAGIGDDVGLADTGGMGIIVGNDHVDAGGDLILAGSQGGVVHQDHGLGGSLCRLGRCLIQALDQVGCTGVGHLEPGAGGGEAGLDAGQTLGGVQGVGSVGGQDLIVLIHPAQELAAVLGGGSQGQASVGNLNISIIGIVDSTQGGIIVELDNSSLDFFHGDAVHVDIEIDVTGSGSNCQGGREGLAAFQGCSNQAVHILCVGERQGAVALTALSNQISEGDLDFFISLVDKGKGVIHCFIMIDTKRVIKFIATTRITNERKIGISRIIRHGQVVHIIGLRCLHLLGCHSQDKDKQQHQQRCEAALHGFGHNKTSSFSDNKKHPEEKRAGAVCGTNPPPSEMGFSSCTALFRSGCFLLPVFTSVGLAHGEISPADPPERSACHRWHNRS